MIFKSIMGASCVCLAAVSFNVNAIVITDPDFTLAQYPDTGRYELSLLDDTTNCCGAVIWFDKENKFGAYNYLGGAYIDNYSTLSNFGFTVGGPVDSFIVSDGVRFTETEIASGQFQPIVSNFTFNPDASIDVPFGTFYVGLAMGGAPDEGVPFTDFAWIQFSNSSTGFEIFSSALAYREGGIIIGTNEAIPSIPIPSAVWLFGSGLIGLIGMTRRKKVCMSSSLGQDACH